MKAPTLDVRLNVREYPNEAPLMQQKWRNLLFLHWEYDPEVIQKTLPKGLYVDQFQGKAYVAITPFAVKDTNLKFMPILPGGVTDFLEMNLRTYVYDKSGKPGVWFYSLDANSFLAVQAASSFFHLPYFYADIKSQRTSQDDISFSCQRKNTKVTLEYLYKKTDTPVKADPDSLEFFLVERYVLFTQKENGTLASGRVHHKPYPLYEAQLSKWDDRLFDIDGLDRPARAPDHVLFSTGVDVDIFNLKDL